MLHRSPNSKFPMPLRRPQTRLHGRLLPLNRTPPHIPPKQPSTNSNPQLNSSLLGETLLTPSSSNNNGPLSTLLNHIPPSLTNSINTRIDALTSRLGIEDFYSAHMLNYCYGQYTPVEVPNATYPLSSISKNVTGCSESKAGYKFDPTAIVQDALNRATKGKVKLSDLNWPDDIERGVKALNALMVAMFVLYVISICLIFLALLAALAAVFAEGRLSACVNFMLAVLAFLAVGIASGLVTAVGVKVADLINEYGNEIGLVADWGGKFLALTWAATGVMLVCVVAWMVEFCVGRRRGTGTGTGTVTPEKRLRSR